MSLPSFGAEMTTSSFFLWLDPSRPDPPNLRPDYLVMTPKVEFSKYSSKITHLLSLCSKTLTLVSVTWTRSTGMHSEQQSETSLAYKRIISPVDQINFQNFLRPDLTRPPGRPDARTSLVQVHAWGWLSVEHSAINTSLRLASCLIYA